MQARRPWNLVAGLGSSGWKKSPVQARLWVYKPCSLLSWLIESPTSGTEEWLARAGLFSCTVIFVFSIIFLVFRNNIHQQTLDSSKLCLSEVCHFHPILHSPPSQTLHSEKLDLTEICRFRISDVLSSFFLLLLQKTSSWNMCSPYNHSTWHDT